MKKFLLLFYTLSLCLFLKSQSGSPDPSFGTNGHIFTYSDNSSGVVFSSVPRQSFVLADGKIIMVLQSNNKVKLTRRLANGEIDASYGSNGYSKVASMSVSAAAIQADGKIVAGGTNNAGTGFVLARFNTDGTLDAAYGNGGVVTTNISASTNILNSVIITTTGKIIAGGTTMLNGINQFILLRYTTTGSVDNTFGDNGKVVTDFNGTASIIWSLALQSDGKIVAAGTADNGNKDFAVARYNDDGTPDLSFNLTGKIISDFSFYDWPRSVKVSPDGKIYVGGQSYDGNGYPRFTIVCYTSNGAFDPNFNAGQGYTVVSFGQSYDILTNIEVQADGKIIATGQTTTDGADGLIELIRLNTDGTIDNGFGSNGNGLITTGINSGYDESDCISVQTDGKIFIGGYNSYFTSNIELRYTAFRFNSNGTPDDQFGSNGQISDFIPGAYYFYNSIFEQNDGKILALSESNGPTNNRLFLSRFNSNGTPDNSFGQNGRHEFDYSDGAWQFQPDGKILRMSSTFSANGDADIMLIRYNMDGSIDAGFGNAGTVITDLGNNESCYTAAFLPDGRFIIGGLSRDNNGSDFLLVRYNYDGTLDNGFSDGGFLKIDYVNEDFVQLIKIQDDGKIVFSGSIIEFPPDFSFVHFYGYIGRVNSNGTIDAGFGDNGKLVINSVENNYIGDMIIQPGNKIVFTRIENSGSNSQQGVIARLNTDGTFDNGFGQNGNVLTEGFGLLKLNDGKLINFGNHLNNKNNLDYFLSRLSQDGVLDPSFGTNGIATGTFTNLDNYVYPRILSGSKLLAHGSGVDEMGDNIGVIAKFNLETEVSLICPANKSVNTGNNLCSALVSGIDPNVTPAGTIVNYSLTGATTGSGSGSASGLNFNTGITTVTYTAANDATKSCSFTVTVNDNQAPTVNNLSVSPTSLWPANHKFSDVILNYSATDNCGIASIQVTVSSNEPIQSNEPEDQSPDWQIIDNNHIKLRAERLESGNGRIYTITIKATDLNSNQASSSATVTVPKSQGNTNESLKVSVSPNPSSDYFIVSVNSNSSDKITLRVIDNNGIIVSAINNVNSKKVFKLGENLKPGLYFVQAIQSGITKTIKVIKF